MASFAAAAGRLAGLAGAVFGWRPDEFWCATPAELGALVVAMRGGDEGLSVGDVEELKRMLRESPSTGRVVRPPFASEGEE